MSKPDIDSLVSRVLARLQDSGALAPAAKRRQTRSADDRPIVRKYKPLASPANAPQQGAGYCSLAPSDGIFEHPDDAVQAARKSFDELSRLGFNARFKLVAALRKAALENLERWSADAVAETGMGRVEDKIAKNRLVTERTPGPEYLLEPETFSAATAPRSTASTRGAWSPRLRTAPIRLKQSLTMASACLPP